ncbi:MAG: VapA/VapB family virulence-associated protein [Methylobacter sp.]|nr:VapA/VapB family virulence-associated protein [Methylobacter sp.]
MDVTTKSSIQLADDFKQHFTGKLSEDAMRRTIESLEQITESQLKAATSYGANGSLASLIFYVKAQCNINGGKSFNGSAWGASFPGGGALFGDVYLVNASTLDELYSRTTTFAFTATPVYTAIYFGDSHETLLGHFQAGSVSTVSGAGKGSGSWS